MHQIKSYLSLTFNVKIIVFNSLHILVPCKKKYDHFKLFFFFEKLEACYFTSSVNKSNHYFFVLPPHAIKPLAYILKCELYFSASQLVEATAIDCSEFESRDLNFLLASKKSMILVSYSFYFFMLKQRISFFFNVARTLESVDSIFLNAN